MKCNGTFQVIAPLCLTLIFCLMAKSPYMPDVIPYYDPSVNYGENKSVRYRQMKFQSPESVDAYLANLNSVLGAEIGEITSRDQILDPYSLVDFSNYRNTKKGQALYNADLERAKMFAERQEAAYQEWYNSEASQASRQREAGLNPDLNGVESSVASDTQQAQGSPIDGIGTTEDTALAVGGAVVTTIGTVVSAVATLGALPATLAAGFATAGKAIADTRLTNAAAIAAEDANIKSAEGSWFGALGDALSTAESVSLAAGQDFDSAAWLSDSKNTDPIFESYIPTGVAKDSPLYGRYRASFDRQLAARSRLLASSRKLGKDAAQSSIDFAQILADPRTSSSMLYQVATMKPIMDFKFKADELAEEVRFMSNELKKLGVGGIDKDIATGFINAELKAKFTKFGFDEDFWNNMDGKEAALADMTSRKANALLVDVNAQTKAYFRDIWFDKSKDLATRMGAAYCLADNVNKKSSQWCVGYLASQGIVTDVASEVEEGLNSLKPEFHKAPTDVGDKLLNFGKHLQQWD